MLLSSFFARSMAFTHTPKVQLPFALFSETFLTIRQNSLYVTVCIIARPSYRGYFIHSLSTLHYCNAPSLATRLTGDYRDRTFTGKCGPASLDTQYKKGAIAPWMITHLFCNSPCFFMLHFVLHPVLILIIKCYSTACSHNNVYPGLHNLILTIPLDSRIKFRIHNIEVLRIQMFLCDS